MEAVKPFMGYAVAAFNGKGFAHLNEDQLNKLTLKFQEFFDSASGSKSARTRGKYFLVYLILRYTGARISEVTALDDQRDIDYRSGDITLRVLKRRQAGSKPPRKMSPVPLQAVNELARYLAQYPEMRGKVFNIDRSNFFRTFRELAKAASIPEDLCHPHVLRHTRALELVRAGVPLTIVQDLLGHASLNTTAGYLRFSGLEARQILKDRGFL